MMELVEMSQVMCDHWKQTDLVTKAIFQEFLADTWRILHCKGSAEARHEKKDWPHLFSTDMLLPTKGVEDTHSPRALAEDVSNVSSGTVQCLSREADCVLLNLGSFQVISLNASAGS
jgi:hypothetical protein